jgi:hypothetical protein
MLFAKNVREYFTILDLLFLNYYAKGIVATGSTAKRNGADVR